MAKTKSRAYDFSDIADYKAAVKVLRRFAPEKFSAKNNYSLVGKKKINDFTKHQQQTIREYMRFVRPLIVYGFKVKKVSNREQLQEMYHALYGLDKIPKGLKRIPLPVTTSGEVLGVEYDRYTLVDEEKDESREYVMATVEVSPGVRVARLHFSDIGLDWSQLTGAALMDSIAYIWETWKPAAMAIGAGISVVKKEGAPNLFYSPREIFSFMAKLQNRYNGSSKGVSDFIDWMHGIDLYFFDKTKPLKDFITTEQKRWYARNALGKKLAALRKKRKGYEKKIIEDAKAMRAMLRKTKKESDKRVIRNSAAMVEHATVKKLKATEKKIAALAAKMYATESF